MSAQSASGATRVGDRIVAWAIGQAISADELRTIATRILSHRERVAKGLVNTGRWTQAEADRRTAPWKAIAVLCGVNTLQIEAVLASYRRPLIHIPHAGARPQYDHVFSDDIARSLLATDLCSAIEWCAALRDATEGAVRAMHQNRTETTVQAARELVAISRALDVSLRPVVMPSHEERRAA